MKKILTSLIIMLTFFVTSLNANTATTNTTNWDSAASLKKVNTIGQKLLTSSKLPAKVTFKVSEEDHVNAYATANNEVYVFKGLLQYVENDDELAAVIAHELGHITCSHCHKQTLANTALANASSAVSGSLAKTATDAAASLTSLKMSRVQEYEADLAGCDLLVAAGYNPLAEISVLNKICENYTDFTSTHPSGDKRTLNLYDYIAYTYPAWITKGYTTASYKSFEAYVKPVVEARKADPKKYAKFQKEQAKITKQKEKRMAQMKKENSAWAVGYNALNTVSNIVGK